MTTLLIIAFLTALTLGFVVINRDNLIFAQKVSESESALQAAYAGIHYCMMRFEQDQYFGYSPSPNPTLLTNTNGVTGVQYDAFPDNTPLGYTQAAGDYWGTGVAIPYNTPGFTVYETGATVVGLLNNNDSHFQIHFSHYANGACPNTGGTPAGYSNNGFDDQSIDQNAYAGWLRLRIDPLMHSLNNLNGPTSVNVGGKVVPPYSAHIVATGYCHGITRHVEAMLKRVFFANSSVLAGGDITMRMKTAGSTWTIGSLTPNSNDIEAGVSAPIGGNFAQTGGNITANIPIANIHFSTLGGTTASGDAYALRTLAPPGNGTITLGGPTYPDTNGVSFITVGDLSGTFHAKADNVASLPPKDLTADSVLKQMQANPNTPPPGTPFIPQTNAATNTYACFVPDGIWAFRDRSIGNRIDVHKITDGSLKTTINGDPLTGIVPCGGIPNAFIIKDYKLMIEPGVHLVVDSNKAAPTDAVGNAQGNFMLTLSPNDFKADNRDSAGNSVIPTLSLAYQGDNQLGNPGLGNPNPPSSLTLGGNFYAQGPVKGYGAVIAQSNTPVPAQWVPSGAPFSGSWAESVYNSPTELRPDVGSGGLYSQAGSQLTGDPTFSIVLYAEGDSVFNPIVATGGKTKPFTNQVNSTDQNAFTSALKDIAGGTCAATGCSGGFWTNTPPATGSWANVGEPLSLMLDYSHDAGKLTTLFRTAKNGGSTGLDNGSSGLKPRDIPGLDTNNADVKNYFGGAVPNAPVSLYQYTALSNYVRTGDISWIKDPVSGNPRFNAPPAGGPLDPVEFFMTSTLNQFGQQAYMNQQAFGTYVGGNPIGGATNPYQWTDLTFQGLLYTKGSRGFASFPPGYKFGFQGSIVASQGAVTLGDTIGNDPSQANFLYDPYHILPLYRSTAGGNPITVQWMVVW